MSNAKHAPQSPLAQAVLSLDANFSELTRLSAKIESMPLETDSDFEQMQRLMSVFAECGSSISTEVVSMSKALNEARLQAEAAARVVSARAEMFQTVQLERQRKMDQFRLLGEKVHALTASLHSLRKSEGKEVSAEDLARMSTRLSEISTQLRPLIEEAQQIRDEAHAKKMKTLEQGAHSLSQSLLAMNQKLAGVHASPTLQ